MNDKQIQATISQLMAETAKLSAETSLLNKQAKYEPLKVTAYIIGTFLAAIGTIAGIAYLVLKYQSLLSPIGGV